MISDPKGVIAWADVYTWQGVSLGAIHYYCDLKCGDGEVEITAPLTTGHAAHLNKANREQGWKNLVYEPGVEYGGFLEREGAIKAARTAYKKHFPQARCLLAGKRAFIEPFPVIEFDGPDEAKRELNEIARKAEPLSSAQQEPYTEKWERLLAKTLGLDWKPWI